MTTRDKDADYSMKKLSKNGLSYKESGVDVEAGYDLVKNITGNSVVVRDKSIIAMMKSPQKYVSKYSLSKQEGKLIARFVFDGDSLRSYLGGISTSYMAFTKNNSTNFSSL